jgi:hypothetical protein
MIIGPKLVCETTITYGYIVIVMQGDVISKNNQFCHFDILFR